MENMRKAKARARCPRCGGPFKRGEQHQCKTGRDTQHGKDSKQSAPSHEEISKRAYELYVARGRVPGHDIDDWLRAERDRCAGGGHPR